MRLWKITFFALFVLNHLPCQAASSPPPQPIVVPKSDQYFMQMAIQLAKKNPEAPFAAVIVDDTGKVLATGLNASKVNPTFHSEMVAINNAVAQHPNIDWSKTTLYTIAEPCAMCQGAVVWAKIPRVVFGTSIEDLTLRGWTQIQIHASEINDESAEFYNGSIKGHVLAEETNKLFFKTKPIH